MYNSLIFKCIFLVYCTFGTLLIFSQTMDTFELHRPHFHFSPHAHWANDPNGMFYHKGEYHLFYQHYPKASVWGPMHWGHAISKDLIHWEHLPIALYPDSLGYIFSGSAVVDKNNTSCFGVKGESPIVAMYTSHNAVGEKAGQNNFQTQNIAYSLDKGRTWVKYPMNPVIKNEGKRDFRDPKLTFYTPSKRWIATLAVGDHIEFYSSSNLKEWKYESEFGKNEGQHGGVWECPDLFPMYTKEDKTTRWILIVNLNPGGPNGGSGTQYFVGKFDGHKFVNDNKQDKILWLDYGKDNYAGVTFDNIPAGRRILMGWMSNWQYAEKVPTTVWRNAMTFPRSLALKLAPDGYRLYQLPTEEYTLLRGKKHSITIPDKVTSLKLKTSSVLKEIEIKVDNFSSNATSFGIKLSNDLNEFVTITYDKGGKQYIIDRRRAGKVIFSKEFPVIQLAPRWSNSNIVKMKLLLDVSSVELFADDGSVVMTSIYFPNQDFNTTELFGEGGNIKLVEGHWWELK